jgi:phosphopantetheinyl transferase
MKKQECPENSCPKCKECKVTKCPEKSNIKSFYTLASKYSDRIRLFANVDCQNCSLLLRGRNETKRVLVTNSSKIDFNMTFSSDYTLDLCENSRELHLDIEKPVVEKKKNNSTKPRSPSVPATYQSKEIVNKGRMKYFIYSILGILGLIVLFRRF